MDKLNILAKFDYDGKTYLIALIKYKIIFYTYYNKIFSKKLSKDEIEMCIDILDSISIRKKTSIYLRNKRIRNNVYQIFYDTTTRLHWWKCITSKEINEEDNRVLMTLYNYSPEIYFSSSDQNVDKKSKSILRMINGKTYWIIMPIIVSFITSHVTRYAIELYNTQQIIAYLDDEQISNVREWKKYKDTDNAIYQDQKAKEYRESIEEDYNYHWDELEQELNENPYLNQEEKDFVKKLKLKFDNDHQYMNIPFIIENLKDIRFTYFENEIPFETDAQGAYIPNLNHIYFANAQSIKDVDERVGIHELSHMIAIPSSGYSDEYIIEIATYEYLFTLIESGEIQPKAEWYDSNGRITNYI